MKWLPKHRDMAGMGILFLFFLLVCLFILRHWAMTWGATPAEEKMALPGDERVPRARMLVTRAITLPAPPEKVWPWLVQIGTRRAGWYSYDRFDNGGRRSAEVIMPEFQNLKIGDRIPASPDGSFGFPVVLMEKNKYLVLGGLWDFKKGVFFEASPLPPPGLFPEKYMDAIWVFFLQRQGPNQTRLLARLRMDYRPVFPAILGQMVLEPIHYLMERKMLVEIKKRLEANP